MDWFAILIPISVAIFLKIAYSHKIVWWEIAIPIAPVFIIVPLTRYIALRAGNIDYERHGGWVTKAEYYEDWNEYIHRTCSETTTDSKGNTTTRYYDCSYVQYHPEYWYCYGSNGESFYISKEKFEELKQRFGNNKFVNMNRWYYTNDGDKYETVYKNDDWSTSQTKIVPITTLHRYENKTLTATGVINYPKVSGEGLFQWPKLKSEFDDDAILGQHWEDHFILPQANFYLQKANAVLGAKKQLRIWILLFYDMPRSTGFDQESYWHGGKKNELVVCIGMEGSGNRKTQWCHPFCWSPDGSTANDELKIDIRDFVEKSGQNYNNIDSIAKYIVEQADKRFERKQFREFNYLELGRVNTPIGGLITIYVLVIMSTGVITLFIVENDITEDGDQSTTWLHEKSLRAGQLLKQLKEKTKCLLKRQ